MVVKIGTSVRYRARVQTTWSLLVAALLVPLVPYSAEAADLKNIRFGQHAGYIRIVLDTDGPVTHEIEDDEGTLFVRVFGLITDDLSQDMPTNLAPLSQIDLRNEKVDSILVGFQSTTPFAIKAFHLLPTERAHHRLVIDLHVTQPVSIERRATAKAQRVKLRFDAARRDE